MRALRYTGDSDRFRILPARAELPSIWLETYES